MVHIKRREGQIEEEATAIAPGTAEAMDSPGHLQWLCRYVRIRPLLWQGALAMRAAAIVRPDGCAGDFIAKS